MLQLGLAAVGAYCLLYTAGTLLGLLWIMIEDCPWLLLAAAAIVVICMSAG